MTRSNWTIVIPGVAMAAIRVAILPWLPMPYPATHDEFSYLLAGDTFAHGRLTNPTHPLWHFFETIHELSIPTYASKYPPGQGFFLAIGERLLGHPFFGVLLTFVLFVTAIVWMLRPWTSPQFALLGGVFTAIAFGPGQYWLESYWGANVAGIGAALVLGALGRIREAGRLVSAWPFAIGIVLLWFTRPYEGGVFVLFIVGLLLADRPRGLARFALVPIACGVVTLAFQAYYDQRVTGTPTELPYLLHSQEYDYAPSFWPLPLHTPTLTANPAVRQFHEVFEVGQYRNRRNEVSGHWGAITQLDHDTAPAAVKDTLKDVLGVVGLLVLVTLVVRQWRDARVRLLTTIALVSLVPIALETFTFLHYLVCVIVVVLALLFRLLWLESARGLFVALCVAAAGANAFRMWRAVHDPFPLKRTRSRVERELAALPGRQVVFVRYEPQHEYQEWVFNSADIDHQHLVWARDLGDQADRALIDYYKGSRFWLLDADAASPQPVAYP